MEQRDRAPTLGISRLYIQFRPRCYVHTHLPPRSQKVATRLQDTQFNSTLGYYNGVRLWTDAVSRSPHRAAANIEFAARCFQNTIEDIYNLMSLTNVDTWKSLIYDTKIGKLGVAQQSGWDIPFGGSFGDAGVRSYLNVYHPRECNKGDYSGCYSYSSVSEIS